MTSYDFLVPFSFGFYQEFMQKPIKYYKYQKCNSYRLQLMANFRLMYLICLCIYVE